MRVGARLFLLPFASVVLGIGIITSIATLGNAVVALSVGGIFFTERVGEATIEHAVPTTGPTTVLPSPRFILAELFDDTQTTLDIFKTFLVRSSMKCESYH